jgi:isopenicillin N synthase-like dioxygenase
MEEFTRFNDTCRSITIELLKHLSDILGLPEGKRLEDGHREGHASNSCLNLIRYVRGTDSQYFGLNKHTDNGTLTLLLTDQWGLQVLSKDNEKWEFVEPKPGHAVINVADTLRFLSGLQFRSAVHRAEPVWEEGQTHRFSFGYFLRAEDELVFPTLNGEVMTAKEWHDRKYTNYQAPHSVQNKNHILLGGMEQLVATS